MLRRFEIDLTESNNSPLHSGGIANRFVEPRPTFVKLHVVLGFLIEFHQVCVFPMLTWINSTVRKTLLIRDGASHHLPYLSRVAQDFFLSGIGIEGFSR